jgi:hypothetical protein
VFEGTSSRLTAKCTSRVTIAGRSFIYAIVKCVDKFLCAVLEFLVAVVVVDAMAFMILAPTLDVVFAQLFQSHVT